MQPLHMLSRSKPSAARAVCRKVGRPYACELRSVWQRKYTGSLLCSPFVCGLNSGAWFSVAAAHKTRAGTYSPYPTRQEEGARRGWRGWSSNALSMAHTHMRHTPRGSEGFPARPVSAWAGRPSPMALTPPRPLATPTVTTDPALASHNMPPTLADQPAGPAKRRGKGGGS